MAWSSSDWVGSLGREASISGVMFVKGMCLCTRVMRPHFPPLVRSCLNVMCPEKFGVYCFEVSLVSWTKAMCI